MFIEREYYALLDTGKFYLFFPNMTGCFVKDEKEFTEFYINREMNKIYGILQA